MSIFSSIVSAIFGHANAATAPSSGTAPAAADGQAAPATPPAASAGTPSAQTAPSQTVPAQTAPAPTSPAQTVDVERVLTELAAQSKEPLNWRQSIVDLMKLLKLDSSLAARKQLAQELRYEGDTSDSAAMNVWLHKQVMRKLAENGGKVPDDLKG